MDLLDANILIGAFRRDHPEHALLKGWLEETLSQGLTVTFPPLVEVAFLRIVTHPGIYKVPSPLEEAVELLRVIRESGCFRETPWTQGMRSQWLRWCESLSLRGNEVNDAYIAASAVGAGCRLVTRDGGFKRFPGLDWWNPAGGEA
ncbi:MAG TPA: TA system VapC family ribonuclease toxin [Thermoanaerobaculia bacterium]|nr:TA system VapC family ribonuclease toxin [Thermoanaerobaculia bacterium]